MTFESLRIQKADDFPELEDASAVTWQVRYGDVTKTVPAPKTDTIAAMKAEIEKSKAFLLDSLKKGKVKDPECVVKPQIRMQKKGIADYKGVFPTLEAARASNKVICLIPSRDGQTYEMRRSELGEFIAPKHKITEFSEVRAGFRRLFLAFRQELLRSIIGFFRSQMESGTEFEALVRIYWDRKDQKFVPVRAEAARHQGSCHGPADGRRSSGRYAVSVLRGYPLAQQHEGSLFRYRRSG